MDSVLAKFRELDAGGNGTLTFDDMSGLLRKVGPHLAAPELRLLFDAVDQDQDGVVSFEEFAAYIFGKPCPGAPAVPSPPPTARCEDAGPTSSQNLASVRAAFPFQGYIRLTEHRGITLGQLQQVVKFAERSCGAWFDTAPEGRSKTSGRALSMKFANLYHLSAWLIRPATTRADCAFVELLTDSPQVPKWFVSHWWGEVVLEFVACVMEHQAVRRLSRDDAYWVCAYANRQHSLDEELTADPRETSFFKAMGLARGVLLILNRESEHMKPAMAFARIWCNFEQATTVTMRHLLLDIAHCCCGGRAMVLTEGTSPLDELKEDPLKFKATRERDFPIEVFRAGLGVAIERGEATCNADRRRILNTVAGRSLQELDMEPPSEHGNYERVNRRLRATLAIALAPQAASRGAVRDFKVLGIIAEDVDREDLSLCLSGWGEPRALEEVSRHVAGFASLQCLSLDLSAAAGLAGRLGLSGLLGGLGQLRQLRLNFSKCPGVARLDFGTALAGLTMLEAFALDAGSCGALEDLDLGFDLDDAILLSDITVRVRHCGRVAGFGALGRNLSGLIGASAVALDLGHCPQVVALDDLGAGLGRLAGLARLSLDLACCGSLADLHPLARCLEHLGGLRVLELRLRGCRGLGDFGVLGGGLAHLQALRELALDLGQCSQATGADGLAGGLAQLGALRKLALDLGGLVRLTSVDALASSLAALEGLESLELGLASCRGLRSVDSLGELAGSFCRRGRSDFSVDLSQCRQLGALLSRKFDCSGAFLMGWLGGKP